MTPALNADGAAVSLEKLSRGRPAVSEVNGAMSVGDSRRAIQGRSSGGGMGSQNPAIGLCDSLRGLESCLAGDRRFAVGRRHR